MRPLPAVCQTCCDLPRGCQSDSRWPRTAESRGLPKRSGVAAPAPRPCQHRCRPPSMHLANLTPLRLPPYPQTVKGPAFLRDLLAFTSSQLYRGRRHGIIRSGTRSSHRPGHQGLPRSEKRTGLIEPPAVAIVSHRARFFSMSRCQSLAFLAPPEGSICDFARRNELTGWLPCEGLLLLHGRRRAIRKVP